MTSEQWERTTGLIARLVWIVLTAFLWIWGMTYLLPTLPGIIVAWIGCHATWALTNKLDPWTKELAELKKKKKEINNG